MGQEVDVLQFFKPAGIPYALFILATAWFLVRLLNNGMDRLGKRFAGKRLLLNQAGSFLRFGIYIAAGAGTAATLLVLTREVLLAVGGTAAVAAGFALKDVVASVVAGLIILVDKPFQVGDRVSFGGYYGEISALGLRSVRLITLDDSQVTVPNNKFLTEVVSAGNAGQLSMMVQMDFHIGVDQELARAKKIVQEALTTSRFVNLQKTWTVLVNQILQDHYVAIRLRAKAYVLDVRFEKSFETDVTERVLAGFAEASIGPPAVLHREIGAARSTRRTPV